MKKFKDILPVLELASRELPRTAAPCLPKDIPAWMDALTFREIWQADDACREYAATLSWPTLPDKLRAQIHLRILQADHFARAMAKQSIPKEEGCETLEFLLVDLWYKSAHRWAAEFFAG